MLPTARALYASPTGNSLLSGLRFYYNNRTEHVTDTSGIAIGNVEFDITTPYGQGFRTTSTNVPTGLYVPHHPSFPLFTGEFTIVSVTQMVAQNANNPFFAVPGNVDFGRNGTSSGGRVTLHNNISTVSAGTYMTTAWRTYATTRSGASRNYWSNGVLFSGSLAVTASSTSGNATPEWCIFTTSIAGGSPMQATNALTAVWDRVLSSSEMLSIHNNPLQLLPLL